MKLFLKNLLFTIVIPGTVAVYVPMLIASDRHIVNSSLLLGIALILLAVGVAAYLWTVWDFAAVGRGTPLPIDAPKHLVARGLYRWVRNPMYLGVLLVIVGLAVLFADTWLLVYALGVGLVVHIFVVEYEEPKLQQLFGQQYAFYRENVGRWLPRIPRSDELRK